MLLEYQPPKDGDARSACPALNMLANHGYIPRTGKQITYLQFVDALKEAYNFSSILSHASAGVSIVKCGGIWSGTINLDQIEWLGKAHHDASLFHNDGEKDKKATSPVSGSELPEDLIVRASEGDIPSLVHLIQHKLHLVARTGNSARAAYQNELFIEAAALIQIFGDDNGNLSVETLRKVLIEERFPEKWTRGTKVFGWSELNEAKSTVKKAYLKETAEIKSESKSTSSV